MRLLCVHTDQRGQRWIHFSWWRRVLIYYSSSQRWQWLDHGRDHGYGHSSPSWKERIQCKMTGATVKMSSQFSKCSREGGYRWGEQSSQNSDLPKITQPVGCKSHCFICSFLFVCLPALCAIWPQLCCSLPFQRQPFLTTTIHLFSRLLSGT